MDAPRLDTVKEICRRLLADTAVDLIIGFGEGDLPGSRRPIFVRKPADLDRLRWDDRCSPNLAKHLLGTDKKAAIVAKPCDARAVVMYLVENQLSREDVYIIGMECPGMKDREGNEIAACQECQVRTPPVYDELVALEQTAQEANEAERVAATEPQSDALASRFDRFREEMRKCILCFSCRQGCYGCYCATCFVDRNMPDWLLKEPDLGTKIQFHLGRALHLTGRCVECGACEHGCPSGVNIRYIIQELTDTVQEVYGYRSGMDPTETPAMCNFDTADREIGFLGGDSSGCNDQEKTG